MSGFQVSEEVVQVFNKLKNQRAHRFIVFKVLDGASGVDVEYAGARDETFEHFRYKMPTNEPRSTTMLSLRSLTLSDFSIENRINERDFDKKQVEI